MLYKSFVCRPEIGPKHFDKLKPEPGPKSPTRPITLHYVKSFILSVLLAYRHKNIFEIKSKCTMVNWQKSTKFHLQCEKNVQQN